MGIVFCNSNISGVNSSSSHTTFQAQIGGLNMSETTVLDVRHLQKGYKNFPVLNDVTFQIRQGHILGLIGKNGAGKTTLMKSVLGLNTGYRGEIYFQGEKLNISNETQKAQIGSLVDVTFYEDMSAYQNLKLAMILTASIPTNKQDERRQQLLTFVGLENVRKKSVGSFSFGMKQRLALALSLITEPALLILDEPFVGLDPIGIEDVKALLRKLCKESKTSIIFSSHQLNEVCDLADDIIVLNDGTIKYSDTYENTKNKGTSLVELMR